MEKLPYTPPNNGAFSYAKNNNTRHKDTIVFKTNKYFFRKSVKVQWFVVLWPSISRRKNGDYVNIAKIFTSVAHWPGTKEKNIISKQTDKQKVAKK